MKKNESFSNQSIARTRLLSKEREIFLLAIQALPNAMIVADNNGNIVLANANAENMFGYDAGELCGQPVEILIPASIRHKHVEMRAGYFDEKKARAMGSGRDLAGVRKDGTEFPIEIGLNPIQSSHYQLVLATIVDISERKKRTDAKLIQVQKMESLGILAGGIAHDFNNLLTSILGYADLALRELSPVSPGRIYIEQVIQGSHRAADLVRQLLAYSGKAVFVMEPLQISEVVEEMGHLLQVSISKKCVIHYHFENNLPAIEADSAQLRQIIMNLIINASDAIGDRSGVISISTGMVYCDERYLAGTSSDNSVANGLYVYFEISDTGCGMDDDTAARIFDPFFTTKTMGRGLGLAAVLGIVRSHGGFIKLYSEVGKGTTFKVLFPPSAKAVLEKPACISLEPSWQGKGLVLVVDDEETIRAVARIMLEKMGFTVVLANDGEDGVRVFKEKHEEIVFVLMDMTMPHLDGEQAFREMRKICSDVQVLLSSGYSERSALSQFSGKGLAGFIQKPYRYDELLSSIKKFLRQDDTCNYIKK